jgi:hypothetical protein
MKGPRTASLAVRNYIRNGFTEPVHYKLADVLVQRQTTAGEDDDCGCAGCEYVHSSGSDCYYLALHRTGALQAFSDSGQLLSTMKPDEWDAGTNPAFTAAVGEWTPS